MAKDSENKFLSVQHAYNDLALKYSDVVIKQKEHQKIICRLQNELKSNITKKSIMKSFNNNNINYFDTSPKTSFYKLIKGVPDNKTKKSISVLTYDAHKDLTLKKTSSQIHPDSNLNLATLKENERGCFNRPFDVNSQIVDELPEKNHCLQIKTDQRDL